MRAKSDKSAALVDDLVQLIRARFHNQSGIVYCFSKKDCDKLSAQLQDEGISALSYHVNAPVFLDPNSFIIGSIFFKFQQRMEFGRYQSKLPPTYTRKRVTSDVLLTGIQISTCAPHFVFEDLGLFDIFSFRLHCVDIFFRGDGGGRLI